jgi:formate dehydrogenase (NADP+) beta subunit
MNSGEIRFQIDGVDVAAHEGQTVLQAAQQAGIYIPTLCSHPDLTPQGGCKLCVVEINGGAPVTSCTTKAEAGMVVRTKTERVSKVRNMAMELILASHPSDCTSCPLYLNCELQAMIQYIGATHSRFRTIKKHNVSLAISNPLFIRDMERCIQCGRCVRACKELRDIGILSYNCKDGETYVSTEGDKSFEEANCRYCGACVEVCPTGALRDPDGMFAKEGPRELTLVPCKNECPAHIDIPAYIRYVAEGKYSEAVGVVREKVPFPHALGYICTKSCETKCRREKLNEPISIRNLKRAAVENDTQKIWKDRALAKHAATGKKVAVIGAGPAGLTAAFYLAKKGHAVTVYENLPAPGGMMVAGIPVYRLPRKELQEEIDFIRSVGVEIVVNSRIDNAPALLGKGFNAVVAALGTHAGRRLGIPGKDLPNTTTAIDFLRASAFGEKAAIPDRIVILGGGPVAFDCARTARRLGAKNVDLMCLEAADRMTTDAQEVAEGKEEGVNVHNSKNFLNIEGTDKVAGVKYQDIKGFLFDKGKLVVNAIEGTEKVIPADMVIFAAGQGPAVQEGFGVELVPAKYIKVDAATLASNVKGIYAAGDVIYGTKSVIKAIESGREAAHSVDIYLGGDGKIDEVLVDRPKLDGKLKAVQKFHELPREEPGILPLAKRLAGFEEVESCLDKGCAGREAERCLQCDLRVDIRQNKFWSDFAAKDNGVQK